MEISIHQPNYIPWSGYFYKIIHSDVFVLLDDVQFIKNSYIDRNSIKTPQGTQYLKIPTVRDNHLLNCDEIKINNHIRWREKHLIALELNYKKAEYFSIVFDDIQELINEETELLVELNTNIIFRLLSRMEVSTSIKRSSDLHIQETGTERLVSIVKAFGGDTYLSGKGGLHYQDPIIFQTHNVNLAYTNFIHPVYKQLWGDFIPNLSILDMIFNLGYDHSQHILKKCH
ncbi:WbqC family protein [Pleomorphochaeta sp. DL1XJH-081]|uniref:WbqC family protein n=1 Tax=Pleomorphochaeta sp. DL1XJH-081 TaxID=3409690 RepID=UPI003BB60AEA